MGQGPWVSLSHCGQNGVLEACGGAVRGGGRPWELVQRCWWLLPVFAQSEILMLNAGGPQRPACMGSTLMETAWLAEIRHVLWSQAEPHVNCVSPS